MTYLTRMSLNPARREGRKLLAHRQAMHAAVLSGFSPETHDQMNGRVLWRTDSDAHRHVLYIVSPERPDLTHLVEQAGWEGHSWDTASYDPFLDRITTGQSWAFRLAANPVRSITQDQGRGKVVPHVTPAQQLQWLVDRSARWGFTLTPTGEPETEPQAPTAHVTRRREDRFSKEGASQARAGKVAITVAQFDGHLQVTDAQALRQALVAGMGRAKGYGCGLMTLAPLTSEAG